MRCDATSFADGPTMTCQSESVTLTAVRAPAAFSAAMSIGRDSHTCAPNLVAWTSTLSTFAEPCCRESGNVHLAMGLRYESASNRFPDLACKLISNGSHDQLERIRRWTDDTACRAGVDPREIGRAT
jgi:hypothetical protein